MAKSAAFHPFTLRSNTFQYWIIGKLSMNTTEPLAYLEAILKKPPLSPKLAAALRDAFRVTSLRGCLYDHTPLGGDPTCAKTDNGISLIWYLTGIVDRKVRSYESICLLGITELDRAILMHSLFYVCARDFSDPDHSDKAKCVSNLLHSRSPLQ